eukprot:1156275-Pelagomonas_calceolata.AAC.5
MTPNLLNGDSPPRCSFVSNVERVLFNRMAFAPEDMGVLAGRLFPQVQVLEISKSDLEEATIFEAIQAIPSLTCIVAEIDVQIPLGILEACHKAKNKNAGMEIYLLTSRQSVSAYAQALEARWLEVRSQEPTASKVVLKHEWIGPID